MHDDARRRERSTTPLILHTVLLLLLITHRLLERLDDQCGRTRHHLDRSLTVLDRQLDGHAQTLPVLGGLGNVLADLLGRQTERTNLGRERRTASNLTTDGAEVDFGERVSKR